MLPKVNMFTVTMAPDFVIHISSKTLNTIMNFLLKITETFWYNFSSKCYHFIICTFFYLYWLWYERILNIPRPFSASSCSLLIFVRSNVWATCPEIGNFSATFYKMSNFWATFCKATFCKATFCLFARDLWTEPYSCIHQSKLLWVA